VESDAGSISGNQCKHGFAYAEQELVEPRRVLTTTVRIKGVNRMLPVRTSVPVPRERLMDVMRALDDMEVEPPVATGQVIYMNILGLGLDIVSTWSLKKLKTIK